MLVSLLVLASAGLRTFWRLCEFLWLRTQFKLGLILACFNVV